jgi:hypothetical protein
MTWQPLNFFAVAIAGWMNPRCYRVHTPRIDDMKSTKKGGKAG